MTTPAPSSGTARLMEAALPDGVPASPADVAARLRDGAFFWLDLEGLDAAGFARYAGVVDLSPESVGNVTQAAQRSGLRTDGGSLEAALLYSADRASIPSAGADYVQLVLTDRFLLTVHTRVCEPLRRASSAVGPPDDRAHHASRLVFAILDALVDTFRPYLLSLDDRLGEIQLKLLDGASPVVREELMTTLSLLTDGIQEFGWYSHDLESIADLPGAIPGPAQVSQKHLERHRQRVARMTDNAREIREEAKDTLNSYSAAIAGRQARVINALTVVATVFLPLSFVTGYFGMNFDVLTSGVQRTTWGFVVLGVLLPLASAALSVALINRLERRLGIADVSHLTG